MLGGVPDSSWIQHICNAQSFAATDPLRAIRLARNSHATDPRDKIYGILGLIRKADLKPNYSLSLRQSVIGTFAHFLLRVNCLGILLNINNDGVFWT